MAAVRRSAPAPPGRRRRDAVRNRKALTVAATAAFRQDGLDIPVDEIARRAGVGVATLYRHFPTKLDLILAVTETVLDELRAAAEAALAAPERADVLAVFLAAAMEQQQVNRGFVEAIGQGALPDGALGLLNEHALATIAPVVDAAHAAGTLDPSYDAEDLLVAMRMLGAPASSLRPRAPERYLALVLGGLARPAR
ncbi:MAG TPA: helix-turn-helix domain-containing protein [Baekduia sp.]|nr:helix-turn-helix domain-containing protein [Baekduia sp.]